MRMLFEQVRNGGAFGRTQVAPRQFRHRHVTGVVPRMGRLREENKEQQ